MNCPDKESLSAFVDGELSGGEAAAVSSHLGSCRGCAARVRTEQALKRAVLAAAPVPAMPEDLRRSLGRLAAGRPSPLTGLLDLLGSSLFRPSVAVSFAAAAAFAMVWAFGRGDRDASGDLSLDMLLAAHSQYAMTMPLAPVESITAGLPGRIGTQEEPDAR